MNQYNNKLNNLIKIKHYSLMCTKLIQTTLAMFLTIELNLISSKIITSAFHNLKKKKIIIFV